MINKKLYQSTILLFFFLFFGQFGLYAQQPGNNKPRPNLKTTELPSVTHAVVGGGAYGDGEVVTISKEKGQAPIPVRKISEVEARNRSSADGKRSKEEERILQLARLQPQEE